MHVMRPRWLTIDIANVYVGLWSSSNSFVACSVVCRIANLLLLATSSRCGRGSCQVRGGLILKIELFKASKNISNKIKWIEKLLGSARTKPMRRTHKMQTPTNPLLNVLISKGSTELFNQIANATSTGASTGADLNGGAVKIACSNLRERLVKFLKSEEKNPWFKTDQDQGNPTPWKEVCYLQYVPEFIFSLYHYLTIRV